MEADVGVAHHMHVRQTWPNTPRNRKLVSATLLLSAVALIALPECILSAHARTGQQHVRAESDRL